MNVNDIVLFAGIVEDLERYIEKEYLLSKKYPDGWKKYQLEIRSIGEAKLRLEEFCAAIEPISTLGPVDTTFSGPKRT